MSYFVEVVVSGLLSGVLYALVALGFVIVYKTSGVFNYAQGALVFFAALTCVQLMIKFNLGLALAIPVTMVVMVLVGIAVERVVLRPLINKPETTLFMATIGLGIFIDASAQLLWDSQPHGLELPVRDTPIEFIMKRTDLIVSQFDVFAAIVCGLMVGILAYVFAFTKIGRSMRAVADDHQAALVVGIPLQQVWRYVWAITGCIALVAGLIWGARNGVQIALTLLTLKALPVLILGGFTSVPGAIVGGVVIGLFEKLGEVYLGEYVGGGIDAWFPYLIALLFLLVRPEGLFGEKVIRRI